MQITGQRNEEAGLYSQKAITSEWNAEWAQTLSWTADIQITSITKR